MKKTKLTRSLLAACSIVALTAVMYGCVHDGGSDPEPMVEPMPEPMPEPEPEPTDLETTQQAAADAAAAAKTASDAADMSADGAEAATANLATLQTGQMAGMNAMEAREAADDAMAEYMKAKAASEAAAAAETASAAGRALENAETAQKAAEAAAKMAADKAMAAADAAKMELMIDGTMKSVGDSSIDADMGMLTKTADDGSKTITGHESNVMREKAGAVTGQAHSPPGTAAASVKPYKQAVAARDLAIGKTLDTTDDMARLTVINSRAGSKMVRVFADAADTNNFAIRTGSDGLTSQAATADALTAPTAASTTTTNKLKSVGMYYEATTDATATAGTDEPTGDGAVAEVLDFTDTVGTETKPVEVFSYVDSSGATPVTRYVVETSRTVDAATGNTDVSYREVDTMARAAPDGPDADSNLDVVGVKAALPTAVKYSYIHFGVWAGLGEAAKDGSQKLASLGIGWVQNIKGGVTEKQGIGSATFNGDWVAVIQRQNSAAKGAFNMYDGTAMLTANFDKDEFKGVLSGLATLEGTLDGNGFSGTKATSISHADLDSSGTFEGSFSGNIYGPAGDEAAGVFSFDGEEAGAFRGAFGGTSKE